jgi:hypothetical protein
MTGKPIAVLASLAILATPLASAQAGVHFGLRLNFPICFGPCYPRPVYVAPAPVYVMPPPVYVVPAQQPVYVQPAAGVYQAPRTVTQQPPVSAAQPIAP